MPTTASTRSRRSGAARARVVAAESWAWNWPGSDARRNFDLAHDALRSSVEPVVVSVEELSPDRVGGTFDVVFFFGVLYHAPDPIGYLRDVRSVTAGLAIVETVVDLLDVPVPAAAYYPGPWHINQTWGLEHCTPSEQDVSRRSFAGGRRPAARSGRLVFHAVP